MRMKFRPSSHSDDCSLIATFETAKTAERSMAALKKLLSDMRRHPKKYATDWGPDDAMLFREGNTVIFTAYTAGDFEIPSSILKKWMPRKLDVYEDYQELNVTVKVPAGMNAETAALALGKDDAAMLSWFMSNIGRPTIWQKGKVQTLTWTYKGAGIYGKEDDTLTLNREFPLEKRKRWTVTVLNE
jgi:hypothetical protein